MAKVTNATVAKNQAEAAKLGVTIPGVGGGSSSNTSPSNKSGSSGSGATKDFVINGQTYNAADQAQANQMAASSMGVTIPGSTTPGVKSMAPVSTLSSTQGKKVVDTKIVPTVTAGKTAATTAATTKQTNATTNAATDSTQTTTPPDMYDDPLQAQADELKAQRNKLFARDQQRFNELMVSNTAETKDLVSSLQASWDQDRQDQEIANQSQEAVFAQNGIRSGQSRYAPTLQANLAAAVRTEGLRKIQNINAKYTASIAEADSALKTGNLKVALEASTAADNYLKEAQTELKDQIEKADKVREKQVQATRDSAIAGLVSQGVENPEEILAALNEASEASGYGPSDFTIKEVGDALKYFEKSVVTQSDGNGNLFGIDKNTGKLMWTLNGVSNPDNGGGGDTGFGPEDKRQISQAGLSNSDERTRSIFINTPPEFRQTYIRNGFGNADVTPQILLNNLEEWEKQQKELKDSGGSAAALAAKIRASGK